MKSQRAVKRKSELLRTLPATTDAEKTVHLEFFWSPVRFLGTDRVEGVELERTRLEGEPGAQRAVGTGERRVIPCDMVLRSIGYASSPIDPSVPFDEQRAVVPNQGGRVEPGLYTKWMGASRLDRYHCIEHHRCT